MTLEMVEPKNFKVVLIALRVSLSPVVLRRCRLTKIFALLGGAFVAEIEQNRIEQCEVHALVVPAAVVIFWVRLARGEAAVEIDDTALGHRESIGGARKAIEQPLTVRRRSEYGGHLGHRCAMYTRRKNRPWRIGCDAD